ncbi:hypothetical protein HanIR_Chr07g0322761 [Helianthus annuus]|nr:hypothetical protein HanIR_Chr07g0322761 [Helianthus annuus]
MDFSWGGGGCPSLVLTCVIRFKLEIPPTVTHLNNAWSPASVVTRTGGGVPHVVTHT